MRPLILILIPWVLGATHRIIPNAEVATRLAFYQKIKSLKAHFHQVKNIKSIGMELKSEGELQLERPSDVSWVVQSPSFSRVKLHGNKISLESGKGADKKIREMTLGKETDPNVSKAILSMMAWMRMDIPEIQRSYVISDTGSGEFRCEPKDKVSSVFAAMNFKLHSEGHVEELKIEEKSGDVIQIKFDKPSVQFAP